ncbi:MAG: isoleucine--tRNA ligase [Alphaproteobacteria bacterium]|nr:MAG: isoleucine--tRNA ligase [Alphaproteobacteria bacterium]
MKYPVALPKTSFPISSSNHDNILNFWKKINLYKRLTQRSEEFLLHDGPPFANGSPHMGHAVNKIMKDIFNRGKALLGYKINYIPGWDCHGLPIESAVESNLKKAGKRRSDFSIQQFRELCRDFANEWINVQKDGFIKMGVIGDFDHAYTTMQSQFDILKELHKFVQDDLVYRGFKPTIWSCSEATALAEAEVEYYDKTSNSVDVKLEIISKDRTDLLGAKLVIWTTTPWTLPANRAVACSREFEYVLLELAGEKLIVASELLDNFMQRTKKTYTLIDKFRGHDLVDLHVKHPFYDLGIQLEVPVLHSDHVSLDQGTGLVHIAPSHGEEDFVLGKQYNLEVTELIDNNGKYIDSLALIGGKDIFESENIIIEKLRELNVLEAHNKIVHSYPHSWRSRKPLIYRVTPQWFISVDQMKKNVLQVIDQVNWIPEFGKNRFISMLESRGDWCISRQRVWGVPLAILYHEETGEILKEAIPEIQNLLLSEGMDKWWDIASEVAKKHPGYVPCYDIVDVWFESGASQEYVLHGKRADVYFEGSDQHRGWFQSSALQASRVIPKMPYKNLITHGFVVDNKGRKMSKSLGNGVDPMELIAKHGPDLVRLWVASQNYIEDIKWSLEHLNRVKDIEKRFRNTMKYMLGSVIPFSYEGCYEEMQLLEKWVLGRVYQLNQEFKNAVDSFSTYKFVKNLFLFCTVDLSAFYFDIRKDILYCEDVNSPLPKQVRMVLKHILDNFIRWIAPIMPFASEEAWMEMYGSGVNSVHEQTILNLPNWSDKDIDVSMATVREVRKVVTSALEIMRERKEINSSLDAEVHIITRKLNGVSLLDMKQILIVSGLTIYNCEQDFYDNEGKRDLYSTADVDDVQVFCKKVSGNKCERCKHVHAGIADLCDRCFKVVS